MTDDPENLLPRILSNWGLEDCPAALIAARENKVYCVNTPSGPLALRLHRRNYRSRSELQSELLWMAMLAENDVSVPKPVPTKNGEVYIDFDGTLIDMLTWVNSETMSEKGRLNPNIDQAKAYGKLGQQLAKMHKVCDAWDLPQAFTRPFWNRDGLVGKQPVWGRFWENPALSKQQSDLLKAARQRTHEMLLLHEESLDYGLIHADLVPENVLLNKNAITMIDFDDGGFGFRLFDLTTVLNRAEREDNYEVSKEAFLQGYTNERPINLDFLLLFQTLRSFTYVGWIMDRMGEEGADERCGRFIQTAERYALEFLECHNA